ncbi:Uncharacterised protein [Serratia grimesii]|jgi:hypothetical protein|nr:Uncharacterised protein [Serratia grimesii]
MFQDISNKKNSNPTKLQRNDIDLFSILYDIKKNESKCYKSLSELFTQNKISIEIILSLLGFKFMYA